MKKSMKTFAVAMTVGVTVVLGEVSAYAQLQNIENVFEQGTTQLKTMAKKALQLLEVLIGLGAAVLIAINFMKRKDDSGNANEGIVSWAKGLIYTLIGILFVEKVLLA